MHLSKFIKAVIITGISPFMKLKECMFTVMHKASKRANRHRSKLVEEWSSLNFWPIKLPHAFCVPSPVLSALHSVLVTVHFCHLTLSWGLQGRQNIREIFSFTLPKPSVYVDSWMQQEQIAILVCFLRIQHRACKLWFLLCNILY